MPTTVMLDFPEDLQADVTWILPVLVPVLTRRTLMDVWLVLTGVPTSTELVNALRKAERMARARIEGGVDPRKG